MKNEKIDIVRWSEDPVEYIVNALSPARILSVDILANDENAHEALVVVPDDQLSLAIGREGQNVRLAHKLTNWKIDIKNESQAAQAEAAYQTQYEEPVAEEDYIEEEHDEENEYQEEYGIDAEDMVEEVAQDDVDAQEDEE